MGVFHFGNTTRSGEDTLTENTLTIYRMPSGNVPPGKYEGAAARPALGLQSLTYSICLSVFRLNIVFNSHVFEFAGIKDIAAFLALDKFHIFLAGHDAHARVLADLSHNHCVGRLFRYC